MFGWKKRSKEAAVKPAPWISPEDRLMQHFSANPHQKVILHGMADAPHIGHILAPDFRQYSIQQKHVSSSAVGSFAEARAWMRGYRNFRLNGFVVAN